MTIIEQTTVGKKNQQECEDGIVVNNGFVAVIDGSTSKTPTRIAAGMTNGRYCMELVSEYVNSMPADIDVQGFCAGVTSLLCSEYGLRGNSYSTVAQAFNAAKENAAPDDFIFIGGSNFTVAEIL